MTSALEKRGVGRSKRRQTRESTSSQLPFAEAVTELLGERGWTQRELARATDVDPAHICRLLGSTVTSVSPALLRRVADAFELAPDFFLEYREWRVLQAVRSDPSLRERLYRYVAGA
jgi:transcriptional regulator with XRE-family HTH domain